MVLRFLMTALAFAAVLYLQFAVDLKAWVASVTRQEIASEEVYLPR
jgi:hypothetical protein